MSGAGLYETLRSLPMTESLNRVSTVPGITDGSPELRISPTMARNFDSKTADRVSSEIMLLVMRIGSIKVVRDSDIPYPASKASTFKYAEVTDKLSDELTSLRIWFRM